MSVQRYIILYLIAIRQNWLLTAKMFLIWCKGTHKNRESFKKLEISSFGRSKTVRFRLIYLTGG